MVKTLIEKTAHYANQKTSLPNLDTLPQFGNQCYIVCVYTALSLLLLQ